MKQFFKMTMATILGLGVTLFLLGALAMITFVGFIGLIISGAEQGPVEVKKNSWLYMDFKEVITDRSNKDPFTSFDFATMRAIPQIGLNDLLRSLDAAADDDRITGIYLDMSKVNVGFATMNQIRNGLEKFKESGKPVRAYADYMGQKAFYMATVADSISLNPAGALELQGLSSQQMFYKQALEKLEVEVQVIRHGKFKGAVEPFILEGMSPENRLQVSKYVTALWDKMVEGVAEGRSISSAEINAIADGLKVRSAKDAKALDLVDHLRYRDEFVAELKELSEVKAEDSLSRLRLGKYAKSLAAAKVAGVDSHQDQIAVVYASGGIGMGKSKQGFMGAETISKAIAKARNNKKVKVIVLRVDSPGGSALASDVIWREIELAKKQKPVVVSMGNLAASGGYYIACGANRIIADESTITGSIGVFGLLPNFGGLLNNKLGITTDTVNTNSHADVASGFRAMDAFEQNAIQDSVENVYADFISKVAAGRGMTLEQVDEIGQGRVWIGKDALEIGLVDELGGLDRAVEVAAKMAKIEDYSIIEYPLQKDSFEALMESWTDDMTSSQLESLLGDDFKAYLQLHQTLKEGGVFVRLPFDKLLE
ncbi:MAG: signal peptide peptidase SppA [Verrucomicrobiales bacterium]|nr:signal peptide peptidase SppA [Verrucomicrobiales bacterium]